MIYIVKIKILPLLPYSHACEEITFSVSYFEVDRHKKTGTMSGLGWAKWV